MKKVVVKVLQGSVVTQTMLAGLTIYYPVANFLLQCRPICAKNYENSLAIDKVIATIKRAYFFGRRCGHVRSEMKGSRATLESTGKANSDDGGSLNEYAGDVDFGKFNEEGSFVGEYATNANQ